MRNQHTNPKKGFTLVELLVVIAIIAVLVTVSATAVLRARKSADKTGALASMRQLQIANVSYVGDHSGRFVAPEATVDGVNYKWFENPEFVSQLKGEQATYKSSGAPDVTLPISMMDPAVVRARPAKYTSLEASYGYTVALADKALKEASLLDASRSAVFITCDSAFVTPSNVAYRHNGKALVAYYDGHVGEVPRSQVTGYGATHIFWKASETPAP